jgi:hypothetical protein
MTIRRLTTVAAIAGTLFCLATAPAASASVIRGRFTASLRGGDLTDPENDGQPDADVGYNATFASSEEPGFGGAELAFNVFDNQVGGGAMKWCCGDMNNFPTNSIWVQATLPVAQFLTGFTVTSGNDTPTRAPRVWQILGSNDGSNFTPIFTQNDPNNSVWTEFDQVIEWFGGSDFPTQSTAYNTFRFETTATGATTGARFQLAELEFYGNPVPEPSALSLAALAAAPLALRRRRAT